MILTKSLPWLYFIVDPRFWIPPADEGAPAFPGTTFPLKEFMPPGCALLFSDGTVMTSFAAAGSLRIKDNRSLAVNRPCVVVLSGDKLFVSDPTHTGGAVALRLGNRQTTLALPADGTTLASEW